jgi:hypothetical protein
LPLDNANAVGYLDAVEKELEKHGFLNWLLSSHLIGISTDGAASISGAENGLIQKIRQNISHLTGVHCVAHMLNLSTLSSIKN